MNHGQEPQTLRDLITVALERNQVRYVTELERIARSAGYTITHTTLNKLLKGKYLSAPTRKTCEALAYLSGVPLTRVMKLADIGSGRTLFSQQLPRGVDKLSGARLRAAIDILKVLVEAEEAVRGQVSVRSNGTTQVGEGGQAAIAYLPDDSLDTHGRMTPPA